MPSTGRIELTAGEATASWRRTHDGRELHFRTSPDGRIAFRAREGMTGIAFEILEPSGDVRIVGVVEAFSGETFVSDS